MRTHIQTDANMEAFHHLKRQAAPSLNVCCFLHHSSTSTSQRCVMKMSQAPHCKYPIIKRTCGDKNTSDKETWQVYLKINTSIQLLASKMSNTHHGRLMQQLPAAPTTEEKFEKKRDGVCCP